MSNPPLTLRELAQKDVSELKGVGDKRKDALEGFGIENLLDLLTTYPRRWVDRRHQRPLEDLEPGINTMVVVRVMSAKGTRTRNGKSMVNVRVTDDTGFMTITFFNQPWREKQLQPDLTIAVFGKPDEYNGRLQMTNPLVDVIGDQTGRIVPIYPQSSKGKIFSWDLARWVQSTLARCSARGISDPVPPEIVERFELVPRFDAFKSIHAPETTEERIAARRRLAFDELFRVQLMLVARKAQWELESVGFAHTTNGPLVDHFMSSLPYPLTRAQKRVIEDIYQDLAKPIPMHRLLQGDVGAGKTVVAVSAMLAAVQSGHQAALMAPTEVLADQHAIGIRNLLSDLSIPDESSLFQNRGVRVELLTNKVTGEQRKKVMAGLADGSVDIVIGTQALIQKKVKFKSLGVVVVDEQHRFGVEQRAQLRDKALEGEQGGMPDVLVMTATPIPRTAAMTVYGDLDVSVLDELPPGRTPIITTWAQSDLELSHMWEHVRERLTKGQQAYVVCPLIEESEKIEVASAQETFDSLSAGELRGRRVGLLHGRMNAAEKEDVMRAFRAGEIEVLVATTVIEVGVDVPNATCMVILDADRFGIAQLHQLRGRVGRGKISSHCYLVTQTEEPSPRVEALVSSTDGFHLAEVDLQLRGEGTIMDVAQKGKSDLVLASLQEDYELVLEARDAAVSVIGADPHLSAHEELRDELELLFSAEDEEFLFRS